MSNLLNHFLFRIGAGAYDILTRQPYWRAQVRRLVDHVPGATPLRALDLGCGPGGSTFVLAESLPPGTAVTGIDRSPDMIARAQRHHRERYAHLRRVEFREADATRMPFADSAFDLVTGHSFLYLVPDRLGVLREVRRVLADDGRAVLMEPSRDGRLLDAAREASFADARRHPLGAARFAASMVLWRGASAAAGRMDPELLNDLFTTAGFAAVQCTPTLGGLGLHVVATGRRESR